MTVALERLFGSGETYVDPSSVVVWEQMDAGRAWLPPHMLSVPGLGRQEMLALSRVDLGRIALASVWIKTVMTSRITEASLIGRPIGDCRVALQEMREDSGHGLMLLKVAETAGVREVAMAEPLARLDGAVRRLSPADAGFWAWMYLAEAVTDALAVKALREADALCPVARQVLQLHHRHQNRRLAACKTVLSERLTSAGPIRRRMVAMRLPGLLRRYLGLLLFPDAASLAALGVPNPQATARAVANDHGRRALGSGCAAAAVTVLRRSGLPVRAGASYPW